MMHVSQTFSAAPPIEQIIPFIDFKIQPHDGFPGLNPGSQLFAVQKLPVGVNEHPISFQQLIDYPQYVQTQV